MPDPMQGSTADRDCRLRELLDFGARQLAQTSPTPRIDAEQLLLAATGLDRTRLFTEPDRPVSAREQQNFEGLITRRAKGEPVAYLLGRRGFWTLDLVVGPGTLIPRPETELLVEAVLGRLEHGASPRILDLGTGSGAIAIAIATECPGAEVHAVDRSPDALNTAKRNAAACNVRVRFHRGLWYAPLNGARFDAIVSNPPYIPSGDPHLNEGDLRFEPAEALVAGPTGLECLTEIIAAAPEHLNPGGFIALEHGYDQERPVADQLRAAGFRDIQCRRDLQDHGRVTLGRH